MYVQPLDGSVNPNPLASPPNGGASGALFAGEPAPAAGDNISRFAAPWSNESGEGQGFFGPLMGMLQQLMQMLQSLMGYGCSAPYGGSSGCTPYGNERFFQNANGSSEGDPHLSFNGSKWNNMSSQPDLLNSNSIPGGFQISTQVTPSNGKGVSWNQSATVSLNDGGTKISMNNDGQASITSYGQSISITKGQTLQLGNGESVTYQENGALRISAQNGYGGRIETTLTPDGKGVNVDVTAHDVDLGGALVNGYEERREGRPPEPWTGTWPNPWPSPWPIRGPIGGPTPLPIPQPYPPIPSPLGEPIQPVY